MDVGIVFPTLCTIIASFWLINGFYAFYSRFNQRRLSEVRRLLRELPNATDDDLRAWRTPVDPLDEVSSFQKVIAVVRSIVSVPISLVYVALLAITVFVFLALLSR